MEEDWEPERHRVVQVWEAWGERSMDFEDLVLVLEERRNIFAGG